MIRKITSIIFSRKFIVAFLLLWQILFLIFSTKALGENYVPVAWAMTFIGLVLVCYIVNRRDNPAYKLAWVIPLLLFPMFTALMYIFFKAQIGVQLFRKAHVKIVEQTKEELEPDNTIFTELKDKDKSFGHFTQYMWSNGNFPPCKNTDVDYFKSGEEIFEVIKRELEKAKKFIFMEFFIISKGTMWDETLEILKRKADEGVEVRLMYDGFGTQMSMPWHYDKKLIKMGINAKVFNSFTPFLSTSQNNRDHRKIIVIDGNVAFNGGFNIADEYINTKERFGYWKDSGVMLKGDGVWNFTVMFLQMWQVNSKYEDDFKKYHATESYESTSKGYVIPFGDSPVDSENVGELTYMHVIKQAKDYVYITTPYLLLDSEMTMLLEYTAKSGVDVRIMLPGIPDKKYIRIIAQSHYKRLIQAGIRIYEFTEGFVHAKNFVSDDIMAVVGTINLDYRSLYLHFECATLMYETDCISNVKKDFVETINHRCREITLEDCKNRSFILKIAGAVLNIVAPLL